MWNILTTLMFGTFVTVMVGCGVRMLIKTYIY